MSVLQLKQNIVELIGSMSPAIVPTTTVQVGHDAHTGDTTIRLTPLLDSLSRSLFVEGSRISFLDGTVDRTYTLSTVNTAGDTATIETSTTLGVSGLLHDHPAGTRVIGNLLSYGPWDASSMLALGQPVIFVSVYRKRSNRDLMPSAGFPGLSVRIQSNRQLQRPDDTVDAESWAQHQEDSTIADLEAISAMLLANQSLATNWHEAVAEEFGGIGSSTDLIVATYGPVQVSDGGEWHYIGTLDLTVLGVAE